MKTFVTGYVSAPSVSAVNYWAIVVAPGSGAATVESQRQIPASCPFQVTRFYVVLNTAPGAGTSWQIDVHLNGNATPITLTIANAATSADISAVASFNDGDLIAVATTPTGTPAAPVAMKWFAEISGRTWPLLHFNGGSSSTSVENYSIVQGRASAFETTQLGACQPVGVPGTIRNLRATLSGSPGGVASYTMTLYRSTDGGATFATTGLACTITGSATTNIATGPPVAVNAGDLLCLGILPAGTPTARSLKSCLEFVPTTDGQSFLAYGSSVLPSTTLQRYQQLNIGGNTGYASSDANTSAPMPSGYTATGIYAALGTAPGGTASWTCAFRDAGISGPSVQISGANTTGNQTGQTVTPADKDLVNFSLLPLLTPAAMTGGAHLAVALSGPTSAAAAAGLMALAG